MPHIDRLDEGEYYLFWEFGVKKQATPAIPALGYIISMKGGDDGNSSSTPAVAVLIDLQVILLLPSWTYGL